MRNDGLAHLRSVHFALVVVYVLVIATRFVGRPSETQQAYDEIHKIQRLTNPQRWTSTLGEWVLEQVAFVDESSQSAVPGEVCSPQGQSWNLTTQPILSYVWMSGRAQETLVGVISTGPSATPVFNPRVRPPETLSKFETFWDDAVRTRVFKVIGHYVPTIVMDGVETRLSEGAICDTAEPSGQPVAASLMPIGSCEESPAFCAHIPDSNALIKIPVRIQSIAATRDLQDFLTGWLDLGTAARDFKTDFPALANIARDYMDLPLNNAERIIKGELDRADDRIQVLGMNIQSSVFTTFGSIFVVAIQVYFYLHLSNLKPQEEGTAFIATYPGQLARLTTWMTGAFFPPVVVLIAFYQSWIGGLPTMERFAAVWERLTTPQVVELVFISLGILASVWLSSKTAIALWGLPEEVSEWNRSAKTPQRPRRSPYY